MFDIIYGFGPEKYGKYGVLNKTYTVVLILAIFPLSRQ